MAGLGIVVRGPWGQVLAWRSACAPAATSHEAEYQAVIAGLALVARAYSRAQIQCMSDSAVLIDQLVGRAAVCGARLRPLHSHALALASHLVAVQFVAIPRAMNRMADALAWEAVGGRNSILSAARAARSHTT